MVMYSLNGGYPVGTMPRRVRRTNGLTYTAEAVLEQIGDPTHPYVEVSDRPSYDAETQSVEWTGTDWIVSDLPVSEEPSTAPAEVVGVDAADTIAGGE